MDYKIKIQDKRACKFCKEQDGKKVVLTSEALKVPHKECTGKACRCGVALDTEGSDE